MPSKWRSRPFELAWLGGSSGPPGLKQRVPRPGLSRDPAGRGVAEAEGGAMEPSPALLVCVLGEGGAFRKTSCLSLIPVWFERRRSWVTPNTSTASPTTTPKQFRSALTACTNSTQMSNSNYWPQGCKSWSSGRQPETITKALRPVSAKRDGLRI